MYIKNWCSSVISDIPENEEKDDTSMDYTSDGILEDQLEHDVRKHHDDKPEKSNSCNNTASTEPAVLMKRPSLCTPGLSSDELGSSKITKATFAAKGPMFIQQKNAVVKKRMRTESEENAPQEPNKIPEDPEDAVELPRKDKDYSKAVQKVKRLR